jgi:hypothetical protein
MMRAFVAEQFEIIGADSERQEHDYAAARAEIIEA